jgi:hypothetical protein
LHFFRIARVCGVLAMSRPSDDTDLTIDLHSPSTQPPSVDPATLRRAMRYGQRSGEQYRGQKFEDVEQELRLGWVLRGESIEWDWVRAAVRLGFEQSPTGDV